MEKKLYSPKEAAIILGVSVKTIQNWDSEGLIEVIRTVTNRRKIPESEIQRLLRNTKSIELNEFQKAAIYARVFPNEKNQESELQRQIDFLVESLPDELKEDVVVVSDVDSGLNDKRQGLMKLMNMAKNKEFSYLYIRHKDRLTIFGFNYLEMYMNNYDVQIIALDKNELEKTPHEELVKDMISIVISFSEKIYGSKSKRNQIMKDMTNIINNAGIITDENK